MRFGGLPIACLLWPLALLATPPALWATSLYDAWPNGPPRGADFFPIAVWYQSPAGVGAYGKYGTQAAAAAAEHINIFMAFGGRRGLPHLWPEEFGRDEGELEAIKANHLYAIGGLHTPYDENSSPQSVASVLALAKSIHAESNLIGYNAGDEPNCQLMMAAPDAVRKLQSYDPTRLVVWNQTHWMTAPSFSRCVDAATAALRAASVASADMYPVTDAYLGNSPGFPKSDFLTYPNDSLFMQGLMVEALVHYAAPGQPVWAFVESGGDNLRGPHGGNVINSSVTAGSTTLALGYKWTRFTNLWAGLTLSGPDIPVGTKVASIIDGTHLTMTKAATATVEKERVYVQGGVMNTDCVASANICVVQGNEYRATPAQVNAEVWNSLINGASGIEYFCHDTASAAFCLGDAKGGRAAAITQANLTYINATVLKFAPVLNAATTGMCSMQHQNYTTGAGWTTTSSCTNGVLAMKTSVLAVPGVAMVKQVGAVTYLLAQSDRRSPGGAVFAFRIAGTGSKVAKIVYDSDTHYDPPHSGEGKSFRIDQGGEFSDTIGAGGDDYQVKIYVID